MRANTETQRGDHERGAGRLAIAIAAGLGVVVLGGLAFVVRAATAGGGAASAAPVPVGSALDPPQPAQALVFVSGAIVQPGLYGLPSTARVADAIAAAGGLTADADTGRLPDMAERVRDGKQVNVPFKKAATGVSNPATRWANRLDVNVATLAELRAVPGMPLGLPEAIVDARNTFGPFQSLSQMKTILGLDGPTFTAVRVFLRAGQSTR